MKKLVRTLIMFVLLSTLAYSKAKKKEHKINPADYTVKFHVVLARISGPGQCRMTLDAAGMEYDVENYMEDVQCVVWHPGTIVMGSIGSYGTQSWITLIYSAKDKKGNSVIKRETYPVLNTTLLPLK